MAIKNHLEKSLEINKTKTPFFKMLISAVCITFPLIIGLYHKEIQPAMFGALMGLVLFLNDHFGKPVIRIKHLFVTFILLMASLYLGTIVQGHIIIISVILLILGFILGKSKTQGIELERMILFMTLQFLTSSSELVILQTRVKLFQYSVIAFWIYLAIILLLHLIFRHLPQEMKSKRNTFNFAMKNKISFRFACIFSLISLASYHLVLILKLSHPYWVVGTALIVMLPDSKQSIYKSFQRFVGTLVGVLGAALCLSLFAEPRIILILIFFCALYLPVGLEKNYWVGNVFIAALILFFLEISTPQSIAAHHLAYWRIIDIFLGSLMGIIAALLIRYFESAQPTKLVNQ